MKLIAVVALIACHPPAPPARHDDACDLVEAMLAIDSPEYQNLYHNRACGLTTTLHQPLTIDLQAPPALVPAHLRCEGRAFALFDGDREFQGSIIELRVTPAGLAWNVMATVVQPNLEPAPDGGFDATESYCHLNNGYIELNDHHWRTFVKNVTTTD